MSDARPDWFGTPKSAVAAVVSAVGRKGRIAVGDLYEKAHALGYGPMLVTDRVLAEEWLCTRGDVWKVLDALHGAGLATLERAPSGARRPSVVTVHPPKLKASSQTRSQTGSQKPSQNDPHPPSFLDDMAPDAEPEPEPGSAPPRAEESRAQRPDQTDVGEREDARPRAGGDLLSDPAALRAVVTERHAQALGDLLEHAQRTTPGHAFEPNDVRALRNALERWTVDDLRLVWDHFQAGEGRAAVAKPSGWSTSWAAIANTKLPGRVRDARTWDARGRPQATGPPARAAPVDPFTAFLAEHQPPTQVREHG